MSPGKSDDTLFRNGRIGMIMLDKIKNIVMVVGVIALIVIFTD